VDRAQLAHDRIHLVALHRVAVVPRCLVEARDEEELHPVPEVLHRDDVEKALELAERDATAGICGHPEEVKARAVLVWVDLRAADVQ
jgi:hypothetical protein